MCGPEGDDGNAHAQAHAQALPIAPHRRPPRLQSGCTSTSCSQPPSDGTCESKTCARADAFHIEWFIFSVRSCAPGLWEREGRRAAQGQSLLAGDADDVEVEIACPQCDVRGVLTPASGRGMSGSQMGPHRGDTREGLREGEGG